MKKKIILMLLSVFAVCMLSSCIALVNNASSIAITGMPNTTYLVDSDIDETITVAVTYNSGDPVNVELNIKEENDQVVVDNNDNWTNATISGFSTATEGDFTATLTMKISTREFTASFDYEVVETNTVDFGGGNGTERFPFLISTGEQLQNINKDAYALKGYHYKLTQDIDVRGLTADTNGKNECSGILYNVNINLDGAGYKIYNVEAKNFITTLFGGSIKNMNYELNQKESTIMGNAYYDVELNSVNITQVEPDKIYEVANNFGFYLFYSYATSLKFINCDNYANFDTLDYSGIYVGYSTSFKLIGSNNYFNNDRKNLVKSGNQIKIKGSDVFVENITDLSNQIEFFNKEGQKITSAPSFVDTYYNEIVENKYYQEFLVTDRNSEYIGKTVCYDGSNYHIIIDRVQPEIIFDGCDNYGYITGRNVGYFFGNAIPNTSFTLAYMFNDDLNINNCVNYGVLRGLQTTGLFGDPDTYSPDIAALEYDLIGVNRNEDGDIISYDNKKFDNKGTVEQSYASGLEIKRTETLGDVYSIKLPTDHAETNEYNVRIQGYAETFTDGVKSGTLLVSLNFNVEFETTDETTDTTTKINYKQFIDLNTYNSTINDGTDLSIDDLTSESNGYKYLEKDDYYIIDLESKAPNNVTYKLLVKEPSAYLTAYKLKDTNIHVPYGTVKNEIVKS